MTIQSWLCLAICRWCKIQEIHIFKLNKIYLHSRHYFTFSNCIFMQLQGIVFIQLQGNDILVNCQGNTDSFKEHVFIHKKYNHSRQVYSDTKLYSFQGNLSVRSRKYILVQWKHIHSGKLYPFKEICSLKEHIFVQVQSHMFIQGNYIYWTLLHSRNSRNIYSKIVPSHFVIIISFTITISWTKYSYNFFRLKDEEIADMIEGSVI